MEIAAVRDRVSTGRPGASGTVSVCLMGQRYWVAKLEDNLNECVGASLRAFTLPLSRQLLGGLRQAIFADIIVRVGFRPGARTLRGLAFDALWSMLRLLNPGAVGVFYWLGTDVLNTTEDLKAGRLLRRSFERAKCDYHLADATWLAEELQAIGIEALSKTLTLPEMAVRDTPDLPAVFSVLTYIPDGRFRFYGGESIYQAALTLPDVRFNVVGGSGEWVSQPLANLVFHGWQSDMTPFYQGATVVVRLMQHDGTGLTAVEGLSLGRHVIYSHPLPCTIHVGFGDTDALIMTLSGLMDQHQRNSLGLNAPGRAYVQENFNHHDRMEDLISYFVEIAADRQDLRLQVNGR